jgi:hypothetical protein
MLREGTLLLGQQLTSSKVVHLPMVMVPPMPIIYSITGRRNMFHRVASFVKDGTWKAVLRRMLDSVESCCFDNGAIIMLFLTIQNQYKESRKHCM